MKTRVGAAVVLLGLFACGDKHPPAKAPEPPTRDGTSVANSMVDAGVPPPAIDAAPTGLAITSLEPAKGDAGGGTYLHVFGRDFIKDGPRAAKIYFGTRQGLIVRFASDTDLIVQAPGGTDGEVVDVTVVFEPGGTLKLPAAFTFVVRNAAPTVDDLQTQPKGISIVGAGGSKDGTLTNAGVMQRIQSTYLSSVKRCYIDYLKKAGPAQGKVSLTFTVTKRGKTSGITVTGFASELDACLKTAMATWTFPVSMAKDGTAQEVSFNVALNLVPD